VTRGRVLRQSERHVPYFVKTREKHIRVMANPDLPDLFDPTRPGNLRIYKILINVH